MIAEHKPSRLKILTERKYIFLIPVICLLLSCSKEKEVSDISFSGIFAKLSDSVYYDSVSYLILNYSPSSELKTQSDYSDSTIYSHSVKYEIDKSEIQKMNHSLGTKPVRFDAGWYVVKRFDLVDKSGKVIYHIPYAIPDRYKTNITNTVMALPIGFGPSEAPTNINFVVTRK